MLNGAVRVGRVFGGSVFNAETAEDAENDGKSGFRLCTVWVFRKRGHMLCILLKEWYT